MVHWRAREVNRAPLFRRGGAAVFSARHAMVRHASEAALVGCALDRRSGRARFEYRIDGWRHVVHALFHEPPALDPDTWTLCLQDLGLAGLVDAATASLARRLTATELASALGARSWVGPAAHALRVECLAALNLPLSHLRADLRLRGGHAKPGRAFAATADRVLLLMGGGKDSLYSYELLRAAGFDVECFYMTEACRTWQQLRRTHSSGSTPARSRASSERVGASAHPAMAGGRASMRLYFPLDRRRRS